VARTEAASWCLERVPIKVVAGATSQPSCSSSCFRSPPASKSGHRPSCINFAKPELGTGIQCLGSSKRATAAPSCPPAFTKCSCTCRCCGCCGPALDANAMSQGMRGAMGTTSQGCSDIVCQALPHLWFVPRANDRAYTHTAYVAQNPCATFWPQSVPPGFATSCLPAKLSKVLPCQQLHAVTKWQRFCYSFHAELGVGHERRSANAKSSTPIPIALHHSPNTANT